MTRRLERGTAAPAALPEPADPDLAPNRRRFLQMTSLTLAVAALGACGGGGSDAATVDTPPPDPGATPTGTPSSEPASPASETPAPPAAAGEAVVAFTLRSPAGGTRLPFAVGQAFRKGHVPAGRALVLDTPSFQVTPISTWDDGSVKHAVVAGRVDLAANVARTVTISAGTAPAGAALTEADLIAAQPSASVSYGSYGTVSLAALLGTSARVLVEHAGPQYAAFQYIGSFADPDLRAVFYVQLWAGGRYRVRVAVENGRAVRASAAKSGTATVSIAGTTRFSSGVSMPQGVRWDAVAFDGTDPRITPAHDVAYLRRTKLVPNYGYTSPGNAALDGLATTYAPMALMAWESDMGAGGFQPAIGLLPHWDALYCTSGDARAYEACVAMARGYGTYSVFYRDTSTRRMPRFSDYPTAVNDVDSQESMRGNGTNPYRWEVAHHPGAGCLAWLVTGERYFLEALQATAWAAWFTDSGSGRTGVGKLYSSQTRARAWRYRTIAAAAALSPDGDPLKADYKASVLANLAHWKATHADPLAPATGLGAIYDDKEADAGFQHSVFESLFLVAAVGWSSDLDLSLSASERATLEAVRDYFYRVPVGLTGRGPASNEYLWRRATGPYRMTIGSSSSTSSLYGTWVQVYDATYADAPTTPNTIEGSYADDASAVAFPQSNWGHVITALSYAKDHGAPGAAAGYARVTGADNWSRNAVKYNDWPQYGVLSRS